MSWPCFWIEPVGDVTEFVVSCSKKHRVVIEQLPGVKFEEVDEPSDGWPEVCSVCSETLNFDGDFEDGWRTKIGKKIYRRPETGEEHYDVWDFGPGAMFDSKDWRPDSDVGPDGVCLSVVLPPAGSQSVWCIDGPANNGGRWTRTGTIPNVTASPSILTGQYHSFLQNGVLGDSLPDRPLP